MKTFFRFLTEAAESQAGMQARKLGLKSDGHGGWYDSQGEFVAKTIGNKLKFYNKGQRPGKDPDQTPGKPQSQGQVFTTGKVKTQTTAAPPAKKPEEEPAPSSAKGDKEEKKKGEDLITIAFGRFNPPTSGHGKLLKRAEAASAGGDLKIYPSRSEDPKKNPLAVDTKISYMRKLFPEFGERIINDPEMVTIFDVLQTASEKGYKKINIVVGSDRQTEFANLANKYNGDLYDFEEIEVISAGARDDDADGLEGISASKLRKAVADGDEEEFRKGLPDGVDDADAQALYDAVRQGMKIKKSAKKDVKEIWRIAPRLDWRGLRENYINQNIFKVGDFVESLHTGLVGKIIRRGTNHLICVTEDDMMFKSWTLNVNESKKPKFTEIAGVPASQREFGTDAYRKYAQSMVPGQEKIRNFINKYKKNK